MAFIMLRMTRSRCVVVASRTTYAFIVIALFYLSQAFASRWDSTGAARAFESATQKRSEIAQTSQPTVAQYLDCARTFRSVHVKDPHFSRTGDAIYQEALLYQEMGDRFSSGDYYRIAVKRFRLLVKDYGGNANSAEALIRLAEIYSLHLDDEKSAEGSYQSLRTEYGYSNASIQRIQKKIAAKSINPDVQPKAGQAESSADIRSSPVTESRFKSPAVVQSVRFWSTAEYTRVILDLDSEVKYEKSRIFNPDRIFFDISRAKLSPDLLNRTFTIKDNLLKDVRIGQNRSDTVRVVLDISTASDFSVSELHDPFRIVIDLRSNRTPANAPQPDSTDLKEKIPSAKKGVTIPEPPPRAVTELPSVQKAESSAIPAASKGTSKADVSPANTAANKQAEAWTQRKPESKSAPAAKPEIAAAAREAAPTSHGDRTLTRTLGLKVGRIVIDPGHGGHDLGTIGPGGLQEKNLVLSLARGLQKVLQEKLGAEVILTRDGDKFLSLEERTSIANDHRADLFISLHANSSRIHSISGVETYYLDFAKNDAEREIAARENASTENNVRDLEDLIKKIAKADKSSESRELASIIQKKLYTGSRQILSSTQNRGVRSAPFIVLIGANMPSVLAEVAFISNPKDERLLNKEAVRQSLVKALFAGIEGYMKTLGSDIANNQSDKLK